MKAIALVIALSVVHGPTFATGDRLGGVGSEVVEAHPASGVSESVGCGDPAEVHLGMKVVPPQPTTADGERRASVKLNYPPPILNFTEIRPNEKRKVLLSVVVTADGNSADVTVVKSSGRREFDQAAADAVHKWQYYPALHKGNPVESTVDVPLSFEMISE